MSKKPRSKRPSSAKGSRPADAPASNAPAANALASNAPIEPAASARWTAIDARVEDDDDTPPTLEVVPASPAAVDEAPPETPPIPTPAPSLFDASKEVHASAHYGRTWSRAALRQKVEEVDDMGFDRPFEERMRGALDFLHDRWFRVETEGASNIPTSGPCLLVANHSGTLPVDGLMLRVALGKLAGADEAPDFRWLAEDDVFHLPFLGPTLTRLGAVRACPENAQRLLDRGLRVGVFPEGLKGIGKLFRDRYQLQRFGRGGFVKLALRTGAPIVPVSILGGEETQPMLARLSFLAKLFDVPYVPVTPTFPLLGPAGLVPAPTKWRIFFGDPVDLSEHGAEAASDDLLVSQLAEQVRSEIQGTLDRAVGARRSVFFG